MSTKEPTVARENGVMGLRARNAVSGKADRSLGRATYPSLNKSSAKIPRSDRGFYDDSYVTVYDDKDKVVEKGIWDFSAYRDEPTKWNEGKGYYELRKGYKLVIKNS